MVCHNCGARLNEDAKFCEKCGTPVNPTSTTPSSEPVISTPNKIGKDHKRRRLSILAVLLLIIVLCIFTFQYINNQPTYLMNQAIASNNISSAYNIYVSKLNGQVLPASTVNKLKQYAEAIASSYENGEVTYDWACDQMDSLSVFSDISTDLATYKDALVNDMQSKYDFDFDVAEARGAAAEDNYISALQYYRQALELNPEATDIAEELEKAENTYRSTILSQVDQSIALRDFYSAKNNLTSALAAIPNDETLENKLLSLDDMEVDACIEDAYSAANSGNWDNAIDILETAQATYSTNSDITDAYTDIREKMPITLENITMVSGDEILVYDEVVKDRWGNIYDGGVRIEGSTNGYALYSLDQKYNRFTGTVFVVDTASAGKLLHFSIYLDEELVYYEDNITEESKPIALDIDTTGATTMRIVAGNDGSYSNGGLVFSNTNFEKSSS